jgi:hypothetical protein
MMAMLLLGWLASPAQAARPAGFVAAVRAEANVVRSGETLKARVGMEVREGDKLVTGRKGRLKVLFSDDAILALGSDTEVVLARHLFERGTKSRSRITRIELVTGTLRALVQKMVGGSRADFSVHTSSAVAGVRGTEFVLIARPDDTRLVTLSGDVDLASGSDRKVRVAAGESSRVESGGEAAPATRVAQAELMALRRATDTEQRPAALAWNLNVASSDRLVVTNGTVSMAPDEGLELDREAVEESNDLCENCRPGPEIEPCDHCMTDGEVNGSAANRFSSEHVVESGVVPGELLGDWENGIELDLGAMTDVRLNIHIRREPRP